jgi:predicted Zn-dependent protease
MTKTLRLSIIFAAAMAVAACETTGPLITAKDIQTIGQVAAATSGKDKEESGQIGQGAGNVAGAFAPLPYDKERDLGGTIAIRAFSRVGPRYADEKLQYYVNLVGLAVARRSERPEVEYSFAVIASDEINAFAGPGGYIFVTTAAVRAMRNEAELAGVLAHEIAHVTERHMNKMLRQSQAISGLVQIGSALDQNAKAASELARQGEDILFNRGYNRTFEYEADAVGMQLAAASGYDARGLRDFVARIGQEKGKGGGWLSTHPSSADRVARMNQLLVSQGLVELGGAVNADRFRAATASLAAN